ncbi:MAG: glycosyltransferase family 9 protein [Campylobacterota bacterium]|nr:glycosyltransferase family 9 protein [Campylobacterota bacterium]
MIRPNYRIGNILFLTPLINEIQKELPNTKIDIIVGMKLAGKILEPIPNIDKVIDIPRKLLLHPIQLFSIIKNIRKKRYDLAINISDGSLSSEITTKLINAKYKASFQNEKTLISLTHTVKKENRYNHAGSTALELLKLLTDDIPNNNIKLDIKLTNIEIKKGKNELNNLLFKSNIINNNTTKYTTVALFRNARFDKKISDEWWNSWYNELINIDKNIIVIDVLSPDIPSKLNENVLEYSNKNLRILGAFFKSCDLYISADTGPLHLALASNAKCLALFNKTSIDKYGTLGEQNLTIDINNLSPKDIANKTIEIIS